MPTSDPGVISFIVTKAMNFQPKAVLDVGPGFGKYGVLLREYFEVWQNQVYKKKDWKTRIDCVEIFPQYMTPIHKYVYNSIIMGNIMEHLDILKDYDLVLLIDVLEHLKRGEGEMLLDAIKCHYIVSTPNGDYKQGGVFGNENESHISCWSDYNFPNKIIVGTQILAWE